MQVPGKGCKVSLKDLPISIRQDNEIHHQILKALAVWVDTPLECCVAVLDNTSGVAGMLVFLFFFFF